MGFPLFRFTLNNATAGSLVISEPGGWDEAVLKLERNQEFHSLVEFYDQPLTFYGQSSNGNGGLDYIREIERSQGPDAQITILIEISQDDGDTYETVFDGLIDIPSAKEVDFYKAEYGIIRNDFWQKFINRMKTPVNLGGSTDADGNVITSLAATTLTLTGQIIEYNFERLSPYDPPLEGTGSESVGTTFYLIWGNEQTVIDEIIDRFEYGTQISSSSPTTDRKCIFKAAFAGDYILDLAIKYLILLDASRTYTVKWYYSHRSVDGTLTETQIGSTDSGTSATLVQTTAKTATPTISCNVGDEIYVYGIVTLSSSTNAAYAPDFEYPGFGNYNYTTFSARALTTYIDTTASAYQVLNAAKSIVSKITGSYPGVTSDYLLSSSGCGHNYAVTKGLYVRGYSTTDKPFYMSFEDWWRGFNPILNLGLGYINGADTIEIEPKSEFYDPVPVLNLDYVNLIERSWDKAKIFKTVEIGYEKWSAESGSGIDDVQTKHTYKTRFKTVGEDVKMLSKFYAASLGIEQTRRNRIELGKDWRLDEDFMVITVKKTDNTLPEINTAFSVISGVIDAERYNMRITPARNLLRWHSYLNGCLKWYDSNDDFAFASGEGNVAANSLLLTTDCEYSSYPGTVDEDGDIDAGAGHDFLFVPIIYEFEYPLTWDEYKAMQAYRKKAIGVSRTNSGHVPCFIMKLEYEITKGKAKFTVLLGQSEPI